MGTNQTENVANDREWEIWKEYKKWKASHNNFPLASFILPQPPPIHPPNSSFLITSLHNWSDELKQREIYGWHQHTTKWEVRENESGKHQH